MKLVTLGCQVVNFSFYQVIIAEDTNVLSSVDEEDEERILKLPSSTEVLKRSKADLSC